MVAKYAFALPNLLSMKQKPGAFGVSRGHTIVDEIVLHGTESLGTETQSLNYLSTANADNHSTHYWIGRTEGLLYAITAEEKLTFHAGNPKRHRTVQDHNARSIGIEVSPTGVRNTIDLENAVMDFARTPKGGLVVTGSAPAAAHRDLIITLAGRHKLPAIYPFRYFAHSGGLLSYGPTTIDPYIRAAGYVDLILKGEKPANLPVQAPTKYELVINMKTATALGLEVPPTLLALAEEVIE